MTVAPASPANALPVKRYDGRAPQAQPATLILSGAAAKLIGAAIDQTYPVNRLRVSPRVGKADRFIVLPDGAQLQCADHPALDRLPQEGQAEGVVAWLEQRWPVALVALAISFAGIAGGYFYVLPKVADRIAARVPIEYEQKLGGETIAWLDDRKLLQPSRLESELKKNLATGVAELTRDLPLAAYYKLEFRAAPAIGPNAFAFPGAYIVVTDELVRLAKSDEEVLAVLAHEIGHVERRHALRNVLQSSATAALATTFTGDVSSLTLAVSGLPVLLAQTRYSREFENEADEYGLALLQRHDISPEYFASMMERLSATHQEKKGDRSWSFLSSHPVTAERIARARAAMPR